MCTTKTLPRSIVIKNEILLSAQSRLWKAKFYAAVDCQFEVAKVWYLVFLNWYAIGVEIIYEICIKLLQLLLRQNFTVAGTLNDEKITVGNSYYIKNSACFYLIAPFYIFGCISPIDYSKWLFYISLRWTTNFHLFFMYLAVIALNNMMHFP